MPRNGHGVYSLPQPPFVAGTVISSAAVNSDLTDIAAALTGSLPRDGQAGMTGPVLLANGSAAVPSLAFVSDTTTGFYRVSAGVIGITIDGVQLGTISSTGLHFPGLIPIGLIGDYSGGTIPSLWYLCYGQAVSRTTYSLLFTAIGTTYGSGDGSTTFNLPDLRGRIVYGLDNMGGSAAGRLTSTYFGTSPVTLGDAGGAQAVYLSSGNLPNYGLSVSVSVTVSGSISGSTSGVATGANVYNSPGGSTVVVQSLTFGSGSVSGTFSGSGSGSGGTSSINGGVGQTPFPTLPPGIVMNKIIYAGA